MFTLLCAPSSGGKSTFYSSGALERFLGLTERPPIVFAFELAERAQLPSNAVIHYNLMRPFHAAHGQDARPTEAMNSAWSFRSDPAWLDICGRNGPKQALVLVASQADLLERTAARREVEPGLLEQPGVYPSDTWYAIYQHANLRMIYSEFLEECREHGVPVRFVLSKGGEFVEVDEERAFIHLRAPGPVDYSANEIAELIRGPTFEYQQVRLPFGASTTGEDRSATAALVLPRNLSGQRVLDIGSALGAVAFEAERRGAARVVGLEPRESRFEAAVILKEILNSRCEFRKETLTDFILGDGLRDEGLFDCVLLLNVIHHMPDPIHALSQCAGLTRDVLAIEFPTLSDPVFSGVPAEWASQLDQLPLMGVSTRSVDQTFIFTAPALERILVDQLGQFERGEFVASPKPNRMIGIFRKQP